MQKKENIRCSDDIQRIVRRKSCPVRIGGVTIGGGEPVAVQSMTDTDTNDVEASVAQTGRIREAGCRIVRLTVQGMREAASLRTIAAEVRRRWPDMAIVADVHFLPQVAYEVAGFVDKVRINPGNYHDGHGDFDALLDRCAASGTALRIGVNHGSLAPEIVAEYGDTPEGMAESAMRFLRRCREKEFDQVVVSMKSSNTRIMVHACRMVIDRMAAEGMDFPLHLGVTEAGNGTEGRIKSSAGAGALLSDGAGDTVRVSLTEPPEEEIPVGHILTDHFAAKEDSEGGDWQGWHDWKELFDPYEYSRRQTDTAGRLGTGGVPLVWNELSDEELRGVSQGNIAVVEAQGENPVREWREELLRMNRTRDTRPVILRRKYADTDPETLMIKAAADFGVMFIDGLADGIHMETPQSVPAEITENIALNILQAARARMSRTEFIACPGCGRTVFALQRTLEEVKVRTSHLPGLRIAVMGCIVNGPGEMADADYGYVGASPGHVTLYRGRTPVKKNIPQERALGELVSLLRADGKWTEP